MDYQKTTGTIPWAREVVFGLFFFWGVLVSTANSSESLGKAVGFNAFIEGDFQAQYTDAQGRIAAGGALTLDGYGVASLLTLVPSVPALVIGGDIQFTNGQIYAGGVLAGGSAAGLSPGVRSSMVTGSEVRDHAELPFSFSEQFALLRQVAESLSLAEPTGTTSYQSWGAVHLEGDCESPVQVFAIDGAALYAANTFSVSCIPGEATIVFNIDGASPGLKNIGLSDLQERANKIIWNFYEAQTVNFLSVGVEGTLLAPDADLDTPWGYVNGTVIVKSWSGHMELHHVPFLGDISSLLPSAAPVIVSSPVEIGFEDTQYFYQVEAIDEDVGDVLTYTIDSSPLGFTIDFSTGLISWDPTQPYVGAVPDVNTQCYVVPTGSVSIVEEGEEVSDGRLAMISPLFKRVKDALEISAEFTARESLAWDQQNGCLGCHIQTQSLLGLETSIDKIDVDDAAIDYLLNRLFDNQQADGTIVSVEHTTSFLNNQTSLALWALSSHPDRSLSFSARSKALAFFLGRQQSSGSTAFWNSDHDTGWMNNAYPVTALVSQSGAYLLSDLYNPEIEFSETDYATAQNFQALVPALIEFFLNGHTAPSDDVTQAAFRMMGLGELKPFVSDSATLARVENAITFLDQYLRSVELPGGGWAYQTGQSVASPVASAWAGIAINYLQPEITDPVVIRNIEYLLSVQNILSGTWQDGIFPGPDLAATSLVMSYLPVALDFLGSPDLNMARLSLREQGGLLEITATVSNRGIREFASESTVNFHAGADSTAALLGSAVLPPVQAGASRDVSLLIDDPSLIGTDIYAEVIVSEDVEECEIRNNQRRAAVIRHRVTDRRGLFDTQIYALNIEDVNSAPVITSPASFTHQQGQLKSLKVEITDDDIGDAASFSLIGEPLGVFINPRTGQILVDGSALEPGDYTFTVRVTDLRDATAEQQIVFTVEENLPPQIVSQPVAQKREGDGYRYNVVAVDPNGDELRYSLEEGVGAFTINNLSGEIFSAPDAPLESLRVPNAFCELQPAVSSTLEGQVKWHWAGDGNNSSVFGPALVVQLTDDNGDGEIDSNDIPDVVFHSRYRNELIAVSGDTGAELWRQSSVAVAGYGSPAAADIDGDGLIDIVSISQGRTHIHAFEHTGALKWSMPIAAPRLNDPRDSITIADLNGDGVVELIHGRAIYDNTGNLIAEGSGTYGGDINYGILSIVADINLDGNQEIIAGRTVYDSSGATLWENTALPATGFNAVGNFDEDDYPEIVFVGGGFVYLLKHDGTIIWSRAIPGGGDGGAPTVADMNGNGIPEIGVAGAANYVVFRADGTIKWQQPTQDVSSHRTGSSVFDFQGNGRAEVVYADETHLRIWDGATGDLLFEHPNFSGTTLEYPVIADINNDGAANILIGGNSGSTRGLFALESANQAWAPTRTIWNQHAYHITNINDDGTVPQNPQPSWLTHNTYRLNTFADRPALAQPDLAAFELKYDDVSATLSVIVLNRGLAPTNADATITFFSGNPDDGGVGLGFVTVGPLQPGQERFVAIENVVADSLASEVFAVIDYSGTAQECDLTNNHTSARLVVVRVTDEGGLFDTQTYLYSLINRNDRPTITSAAASTIVAGDAFDLAVVVEDPDVGDAHRFSLVDAPQGVSINEKTGAVSADAGVFAVGLHSFTIIATDLSGAQAEQVHVITVARPDNLPPTFTSVPPTSVLALDELTYTATASDPDGDEVVFLLSESPVGAVIDGVAGEIRWTPTRSHVGIHIFDVTALDTNGASTSQRFAVEVLDPYASNHPPEITSKPSGAVVAGKTFEYQLVAVDPDGDALSYDLIGASGSMQVSDRGRFTWLPAMESVGRIFTVDIRVSDPYGAYAVQSLSLPVNEPANSPPKITSTPLAVAFVGEAYLYQLEAFDADGDVIRFELGQEYPNGMSMDSTGLTRWTPDEAQVAQTFTVEVRAIDGRGAMSIQSFSIAVNPKSEPNEIPYFVSAPTSPAVVGEAYIYQARALDPDLDPLTFTLASPAVDGLSLSSTGLLEWTPVAGQEGSYEIAVRVSDGKSAAVQSYTLQVVGEGGDSGTSNTPPSISSTPPFTAATHQLYQYQVVATDADGDPLTYHISDAAPAGMQFDINGMLTWIPDEHHADQSFPVELRVQDDRGGYSTQSFSIAVNVPVEPNQLPRIDSSPASPATVGEEYRYQVIAVDPDSDPLTYQLIDTDIAGLTLSPTGELTWTPTPSQVGEYPITIRVSDGKAAVTQSYTLAVREPTDLTNAYPVINSSPATEAVINQLYVYQIEASDPDGDALSYELLSELKEGMAFSSSGLLQWTPGPADVGIVDLLVKVSDGQLARTQSWSVKVWDGVPPLRVSLSISPTTADQGDLVTFSVEKSGGPTDAMLKLYVDGVEIALDSTGNASTVASGYGLLQVRAVATSDDVIVEETGQYLVRDPSDTVPPIAEIIAPGDTAVITEPVAIIGTASDENLVSYELYIAPRHTDNWAQIASGDVSIEAGELGILDPTMMVNGQYALQLQVTDVNGQMTSASSVVTLDGDLKVGNFSFTVTDLVVPMVGIPIQVNRTYDSRRRFEDLDFGYGWSIDYQNARVEESRTPGTFWAVNQYNRGPLGLIADFCVEPLGAPVVTVTLPNGKLERFEVGASPQCSTYQVIKDVSLVFNPVGDTQSTLEALNDSSAYYVNGQLVETGYYSNPVNPSRYKLTTQAGYEYYLSQGLGIEKVVDPNGHTLTYTSGGIFHSSGKAVTFERNSKGRITDVIAPNGTRLTYHYDGREDLERVIDRDESTTQYTYNNAHGLLDIIDPLNRPVLKNLYDDEGRLYAQEDGNGQIKTFDHDLDAKTSLVTDRDGRSTLLEYDERGLVQFETVLIGDGTYNQDIVIAYSYDANGNQETRAIGDSVWIADFDARNNQLFAQDPEGNTVFYREYNDRGQETVIEDEMGRVSNMQYDTVGNLYLVELPDVMDPDTGEITTPSAGNQINSKGQVKGTTDLSGLTTIYTYYPDGHQWEGQKWTEANDISGTITFTYDANNNVKSETRERTVNGEVVEETVSYLYDNRDRLTKTTYPDGSYTETVYDLAGDTDKERDRLGNWTDYTYDAYGRLTHTYYADGTVEVRTYSNEGLLETVTDRSGFVIRHEYDGAGRLWKVHNEQDGTFTETRYTVQGWVEFEWDEKRNLTEHKYDLAGRRTQTIRLDSAGRQLIWGFEYYPNGELHKEIDPLGHTTEYVINELDQRIATLYHNGTTVEERYDLMGRRTAAIDQNLRRTAFEYDDLGRLQGVTPEVDINGEPVPTTSYTYDEVGNQLTQTDANGHTTTWTYDYFGRVISRTLPEGMVETFEYFDSLNLIVHTDFNGDTITTTQDVMGRVERVEYSKDGAVESYTYWPNDQVKVATTADGVTEYFYDHRHRLDHELRPNGARMDYAYDDAGNRTLVKITRAGQVTSQTSYTYDSQNRLETVTNDLVQGEVSEYGYDDAGNLDTVTYPNGLVTDYDYNSLHQLTDVYTRDAQGNLISHYHYTLGNTGRRTVIRELDGRTTAYCHDDLYRLSAETVFDTTAALLTHGCLSEADRAGADYTADYEYDWTGNRLYETVDGVQTAYLYDTNDRLQQTGGTVYSHDNNGNTRTETLDGVTTVYTYNGKNQMVSVDKGGEITAYHYNPNGIRDRKTEGGTTTHFIVDENRDYAQVLEEVVGGTAQVSYSYGHDLISQNRAGATSFYHYDGLGSTRALSNASGSLTDTYDYEAFGEVLSKTGTTENRYLFTGEQFDGSLNQYYLRARYYDQGVGRFTQMDTWAGRNFDPITLHKYVYGNADPVNYVDPTGNFGLGSFGASFNIQFSLASSASSTIGTSAVGKVLAGLVGAGIGIGVGAGFDELISRNAPAINRALEEKRVREKARVERRARSGLVLYHYTDRISAIEIGSTGTGFVTPSFRGLGTGGNTRPAGFYATDIAPWESSYRQSELSALFYGGNRGRDVSWFVAVDGSTFSRVHGAPREYVHFGSVGSGPVQLDVITIGPNLMLP